MLDKQDLQAIKELIDGSVTASEARMKSYVDGSISSAVRASEERMKSYVDGSISSAVTASEERMKSFVDSSIGSAVRASEERTRDEIRASESRIHAYIEAAVMPKFQILADGHQNILDTLAPKSRVDDLEDDVIFLKSIVKTLMQRVTDLEKAQ